MAEIGAVLHFRLADLDEMDGEELRAWHDEARRIAEVTGIVRKAS